MDIDFRIQCVLLVYVLLWLMFSASYYTTTWRFGAIALLLRNDNTQPQGPLSSSFWWGFHGASGMASKGQTTGEEQLLTQKPMGFVEENRWKKVQVYSGNLPGKHIVCPLCQRKLVAGFRGKVTWKWTATCLSSCQGGYFWLTLQVQQVKELQEGIENLGRKFSPSWKTGERELPWKDGNIWFIMIR